MSNTFQDINVSEKVKETHNALECLIDELNSIDLHNIKADLAPNKEVKKLIIPIEKIITRIKNLFL